MWKHHIASLQLGSHVDLNAGDRAHKEMNVGTSGIHMHADESGRDQLYS